MTAVVVIQTRSKRVLIGVPNFFLLDRFPHIRYLLFVDFDWRKGEVTFTEMWVSALQRGVVRSNFVDARNDRRYLFAERLLGCIPMSCRLRQRAARVRGVALQVIRFMVKTIDVPSRLCSSPTALGCYVNRGPLLLVNAKLTAAGEARSFLAKDMRWIRVCAP